VSAVGYSGESAVTDPTAAQLPTAPRQRLSRPSRSAENTDVGKLSAIERLGAWVAPSVILVASAT
jgi:hypothetical protein